MKGCVYIQVTDSAAEHALRDWLQRANIAATEMERLPGGKRMQPKREAVRETVVIVGSLDDILDRLFGFSGRQ